MKKKMTTALLLIALAATAASGPKAPLQAQAAAGIGEEVGITLYGQPFLGERSPLLVNGTVLVPLRGLAESLGAEVDWEEGTQTVTLRKADTSVRLTIGSREASKNGVALRLDTPPQLIGEVTMVPLRLIGESFDAWVTWNGEARMAAIDHLPALPVVGSQENLQLILQQTMSAYSTDLTARSGVAAVPATAPAPLASAQSMRAPASAGSESAPSANSASEMKAKQESSDFSTTNTQVEGVDEADVIKTDGAYLYQVNKDRIVITQAVPAAEMKVASVISFSGATFRPTELYVDDSHLVVIGTTNRSIPGSSPAPQGTNAAEPAAEPAAGAAAKRIAVMPVRPTLSSVKAIVYDITDKTAPKQLREVELDGQYVSSRKIDSALYVIANQYAGYYGLPANGSAPNLPAYRDTSVSADYVPFTYDTIRYFPESRESSYMLIGGIDLNRPEQPMDVSAYLGSGQNVFASDRNLYTAVSKSVAVAIPATPAVPQAAETKSLIAPISPIETKTVVYKFRLDQGKTTFTTQTDVPGTILNQFSMDEYNGIFRIATTKGDMWRTDENTSKNNMYTYDEALKPLGKLEGIAPGERIYSVRFMGNRAYMVTFKNTDPLFAIDLTNPSAPAILGALKIPGYSDYLHPYDETHLIGFGKETVEVPVKGNSSNPTQTIAYYQGMKLSLFDVSDVSNPVEQFKTIIGDRGTDSELLRNHKALLFSRQNNLLAFPVTVMTVANKPGGAADSPSAYGQFTFQGAYVYELDLTNGFRQKAAITHMTDEQLRAAGTGWYNSERNVERILYIGDTLYTLSKQVIQANDMNSFQLKGSLQIP